VLDSFYENKQTYFVDETSRDVLQGQVNWTP